MDEIYFKFLEMFQVMPNGHLASVTLYLPQDMSPLPMSQMDIVDLHHHADQACNTLDQ